MKTFKTFVILTMTVLVLGVCALELKKNVDLRPKIELIQTQNWSLTKEQVKQFEALNQSLRSELTIKTFVSEFSNIFSKLSKLTFIDDARWAWDHQQPLKIKAYVTEPKAMLFKNNDWYLISDKGQILKKVATHQTLDLPIFTAEALLLDKQLRAQSFAILQAFEAPNSTIPLSAVSEISQDARGLFVRLSEGFKVYISDKNPTLQIERVNNVLSYLKKENIQVEFIDAQSVQKVLVRPKPKK